MTIEQLRTILQAKPFKPFTIHVADQHAIRVRHPELVLMTQGGRTMVVNTGGENLQIIDLLLVTRLSQNGDDRGRGKARRPRRR